MPSSVCAVALRSSGSGCGLRHTAEWQGQWLALAAAGCPWETVTLVDHKTAGAVASRSDSEQRAMRSIRDEAMGSLPLPRTSLGAIPTGLEVPAAPAVRGRR